MEKEKSNIVYIIAIAIVIVLIGIISVGIFKNFTTEPKNPIATMEIEGYGTVKIELYPDKAPNTVANFIKLVDSKYYNGLTFHRVIKDFMIQGGDKKGDGTGTPRLKDLYGDQAEDKEYAIKGEFVANKFNNNLKLSEGVIAMARQDYSSIGLVEEGYNSAGSQFFIMTSSNSSIDGLYAPFGKVIEGYEIIKKISELDVTYKSADIKSQDDIPKDAEGNELSADMPLQKPVITSITVDTFGVDYGNPETIDPFNYEDYMNKLYGSNAINTSISE